MFATKSKTVPTERRRAALPTTSFFVLAAWQSGSTFGWHKHTRPPLQQGGSDWPITRRDASELDCYDADTLTVEKQLGPDMRAKCRQGDMTWLGTSLVTWTSCSYSRGQV